MILLARGIAVLDTHTRLTCLKTNTLFLLAAIGTAVDRHGARVGTKRYYSEESEGVTNWLGEEARRLSVVLRSFMGTNTTADAAAARGINGEEVESSSVSSITPNDLIELVRAVKFANTNASIREVHTEISITMAQSNYPTYAFLKDVKLNDVKKVWKKAIKGGKSTASSQEEEGGEVRGGTTTITASSGENNDTSTTKTSTMTVNDGSPSIPADGIIKFYTIGDGSVKTLVENYSKQYAQKLVSIMAEDQTENSRKEESSSSSTSNEYTHFFLNVPADLSGLRPHQALINYSQDNNNTNRSSISGGGGKKKKKKNQKGDKQPLVSAASSSSPSSSSSSSSSSNDDDKTCEIFKIQLAALPPGMENVLTPMLLYNKDRSAKTFLHPPNNDNEDEDDDGGYNKIRNMIIDNGCTGALGVTGGTKAYFYGYITKVTSELLPGIVDGTTTATATNDIVSIRTTELVLNQIW
jgi:hypothetical protein